MQYFTQVDCSLLSMVMDCILIQEVKGLTKKLYFVIPSRRKMRIFYMVMGCNIIQEVKGLTNKLYIVLLSRRKTSFCEKFQVNCSHCVPVFLHGCGLHYNVKQEVKGLTTNYSTTQEENWFTCKYLSSLVLRLVSFTSS